MNTFAPTAEQLHIHDLFRQHGNIRIRAGAGTGKTTTLTQLADIVKAEGQIGLYIAFNKSIAVEAGSKFPNCITASTAHSLAYRGIANTKYAPLLRKMRNSRRVPFFQTARDLNINGFNVTGFDGTGRFLTDRQVARHALATIDRWCKTADRDMTVYHVPPLKGLDADGDYTNNRLLAENILPYAKKVWANLLDPNGTAAAFGHGHYLKLWQLTRPRLGRDGAVLMVDEAQDTAPVLAAVISDQTHLRRVVVGDQAQAIYRFTGATDYMTQASDSVEGRLTQSWRFGQIIADAANGLLARLGDDMRLTGNPGRNSIVTHDDGPADTILCRTNGGALAQVMAAQTAGTSVYLMADTQYAVRFCDAADDLKQGRTPQMEDLAAFTSWGQVQEYAEEAADASDWKTLVALIDKHGTPSVRSALSGVVDERRAELVVATAHKSKGREWGRVRLASDLAEFVENAEDRIAKALEEGDHAKATRARANLRDELMLSYVATTRAMHSLNPGQLIAPALTAVA